MQNRHIFCETIVEAPRAQVWEAWTTADGIRSFLAPACGIELRPGGPYEIYFNPDAPEGLRGGDTLRILAFQAPEMLSFTWNAPPSLPQVRPHHTHVLLRFYEEGENRTRLTLTHDGWGSGGEWDEAFKYFSHAWPQIVLPRLQARFESGPIDWANPPQAS